MLEGDGHPGKFRGPALNWDPETYNGGRRQLDKIYEGESPLGKLHVPGARNSSD